VSTRWPTKTVIGLTGNIAMGKSVVRRMLEHLGAFGIDADGLAHRAMSPGAPAYEPVVDLFGRFVLTREGRINRARLGRIVFNDPEALAELEKIVHPIVGGVIGLLVRRATQKVVVLEAIKLFESGLAKDCDTVWVVDATPEVQVKRLMQDRSLSEAEARLRVAAQPPQADKLARARTIISNSAGYESTFAQVEKHFRALVGPAVPTAAEPAPVPVPAGEVAVRRAGPAQAQAIADMINTVTGKKLTRSDVLVSFGKNAYMLAYIDNRLVSVAGWQIENLVTRITEFLLLPDVEPKPVVSGLVKAIEQASNDLQSEIALIFLAKGTSETVEKALLAMDYARTDPADFRVPDWREAAEESAPANTYLLAKKLREDRVLRPI